MIPKGEAERVVELVNPKGKLVQRLFRFFKPTNTGLDLVRRSISKRGRDFRKSPTRLTPKKVLQNSAIGKFKGGITSSKLTFALSVIVDNFRVGRNSRTL